METLLGAVELWGAGNGDKCGGPSPITYGTYGETSRLIWQYTPNEGIMVGSKAGKWIQESYQVTNASLLPHESHHLAAVISVLNSVLRREASAHR